MQIIPRILYSEYAILAIANKTKRLAYEFNVRVMHEGIEYQGTSTEDYCVPVPH